jgi:hypothetical protein
MEKGLHLVKTLLIELLCVVLKDKSRINFINIKNIYKIKMSVSEENDEFKDYFDDRGGEEEKK